MSEADAVARVHLPATVESLAAELAELGVRAGDVLLVHSSLSALGWVAGGAVAVIEALEHALGGEGTLVMPAFSTDLSDPSRWQHPPVPRGWWPVIRDHLPAFDPRRTPTRAMGAIAELFRTLPGVLRSAHPTASFAAAGPRAAELIREHPLEDPLGEDSPLGRLHELGARVLLLGVGHDRNTSLHLAERRAFRHLQALERTRPRGEITAALGIDLQLALRRLQLCLPLLRRLPTIDLHGDAAHGLTCQREFTAGQLEAQRRVIAPTQSTFATQ